MALTLVNRTSFIATSTGTGDFVQASSRNGFRSLTGAVSDSDLADGATVHYLAVDNPQNVTQFEWGEGTFTNSTKTISRSTRIGGSNGPSSKVSFNVPPTVDLIALAPVDFPILPATTQSTVSAPAAKPNSTTAFTMQGLAGSFTPARTGTALIVISGFCNTSQTTAARGIIGQVSYGTGTAPSSLAALAGTQVGGQNQFEYPTALTTAAAESAPISWNAAVTGLTVGTAYWIDLACKAIGVTNVVGLSQISISVLEG